MTVVSPLRVTLALAALSWLVSACAAFGISEPVYYARTDDPKLTARYGTKQLLVSGPVAFAAVEAGLRAEGYDVAIANRERGLIRTAPKLVNASAYADSGGAHLVDRAYLVVAELAPDGDRVKVALTIRHYRNGMDVSATDRVRADVLRKLWHQLFDAIYDALPPREAAPVDAGPGQVF